jgi:hypothetical protein
MSFLVGIGIALLQIVVAFYGFWFVWRVLLPILPGPERAKERIAPFACYFTDPLVNPIAQRLRLNTWMVSALFLLLVAAVQVGLTRFAAFLPCIWG